MCSMCVCVSFEEMKKGVGGVAQWYGDYLAFVRPWVQFLALKKKKISVGDKSMPKKHETDKKKHELKRI